MPIKRQHYVPEGFLKGFTIKDETPMIWVYEKLPNRSPRKVSTRSIAWEEYYYQQETASGEVDYDTVEKNFAKIVDSKIPPILARIVPLPGRVINLTEDERGKIAFFIGISMTRVPSFRKGIEDIFSRLAHIMSYDYARKNDEKFLHLLESGLVKAEAKNLVSLEPMVRLAEIIGLSVLKKNWQFFVASPEQPFVTSDNPVIFSSSGHVPEIDSIGPAHPLAEIVINLRSDLALVCTPKKTIRKTMFLSKNL